MTSSNTETEWVQLNGGKALVLKQKALFSPNGVCLNQVLTLIQAFLPVISSLCPASIKVVKKQTAICSSLGAHCDLMFMQLVSNRS